jgi:hypothetical protein
VVYPKHGSVNTPVRGDPAARGRLSITTGHPKRIIDLSLLEP